MEACQQALRETRQAYAQLEREHQEVLDTCASIQASHQKLQQEKEEQQLTIQHLLQQLYGRRVVNYFAAPFSEVRSLFRDLDRWLRMRLIIHCDLRH